MIEVIQMDVLEWATKYDGLPFHAMLCDPPYHLTSITKRFGSEGSAPAQYGKDGAFQRASRGFMGQQWDGGDVAFRSETWAALAEHLYPGAFVFAFGGCRTYHRLACALEDAGLRLHNAVGWVFSTGFPKATRVKTGQWQSTGEVEELSDIRSGSMHAGRDTSLIYRREKREPTGIDAVWQCHRYGLQSLKPALELVAVAQKLYEGRPVDSITETGAGALNVDAGRVGTNEDCNRLQGTMPHPMDWGNKSNDDNTYRTEGHSQ